MRVLVTGATGFIGANLVRVLLERDVEVRVLRRQSSPTLLLDGLPVETFTGHLTDPESMENATRGCSQVYHLAGAFETGPDAEARMLDCHEKGTRVLGEAALRMGVKRMVVCSSSITLPFGPLDAPAAEDDDDPFEEGGVPYRHELLAYYRAKKAQEREARALIPKGLETVIVHPDFVLGPWDIKPTSGALILQIARSPWIPFYPPGGKSFIGARDCALGHVLAMERGKPGRSYLLGDHNLTYGEAMKRIARVVSRPPPAVPLPSSIPRFVNALDRVFGRQGSRLSHLATHLESLFIGRYRSPERARRELGLKSTPFETFVDEAWKWFRDHDYVRRRR